MWGILARVALSVSIKNGNADLLCAERAHSAFIDKKSGCIDWEGPQEAWRQAAEKPSEPVLHKYTADSLHERGLFHKRLRHLRCACGVCHGIRICHHATARNTLYCQQCVGNERQVWLSLTF